MQYGDDMEEYRRWEDNIKMDIKEIGVDVMSQLRIEINACHYGDDMEEYRRPSRWEDNIKMDIKEIAVDVMSQLRIEINACYYGDDREEYRRPCRWEDNIKKVLKEVGVDVMSLELRLQCYVSTEGQVESGPIHTPTACQQSSSPSQYLIPLIQSAY